jgi:protein-(glutamine-N5) methyltransferase, release factor-specific
MKIYEMLKEANDKARKANIEEYELKVRYIFEDLFKEKEVDEKEFLDAIDKLCEGYPYQYITKNANFFGYDIYVDENVLIPRLDTEILVDCICRHIEEKYNKEDSIRILEIGVGSGALIVAILKRLEEYNNIMIDGIDISKGAIEVAKKNIAKYNLENKVNIYMKDILNEEIEEKYDIIYSNPPYLTSDEMGEISDDVRKEPSLALYGGEDGLEYYRRIIGIITKNNNLKEDGKLFLEIGYMQKQEVFDIAKENGYREENISCIKDLENRDRVIILC